MDYWKVVHEAIPLNPVEERDMAVLQGFRNLGIEKGKPFDPTAAQTKILEEAALVGETRAMGNSFLKHDPVRHWTDDPKSQWQYISPPNFRRRSGPWRSRRRTRGSGRRSTGPLATR
jgi:hypothetical protein